VLGKILKLLKEVLPRASQVTVLTEGPSSLSGATEAAARQLGLRLERSVVKDPFELESTLAAISRQGADAVYLPLAGFLFNLRNRVAALAVARRLPTFGLLRELPGAGGLLSYGQSLGDLFRRAATFVDKILKGAKPADLPVEQATKSSS
jgi:putative ABC transport system substrate-binding protein